MGRKGMKGFMKSASRPSNKPDEDDESTQDAAAATTPAASSSKAAPAATPAAQAAAAAPQKALVGADAEADDSGHGETRGKMLQRHKREMLAHKKAVQRMGKKSKEELTKLDAEIEARHAAELAQLEAAEAAAAAAGAGGSSGSTAAPAAAAAAESRQAAAAVDGSAAEADRASKYLKDLSVGEGEGEEAGGKGKKLSKAQRRREKAAAKDAEREARIAAELAELGPSERATEEEALQELLAPLGLAIKEIRADGHCLYRSLEDQLQQTAAAAAASGSNGQQQYDFQQLRELAAQHIRQHREQFAPFLLPEDESVDSQQYLEQYCATLESTAAWGGHLELTALSAALQRHIRVHAVGMDIISIGEEDYGKQPPLEVCYLRHAFGLGEHYNSTKQLLLGALAAHHDGGEHEGSADAESDEE